MSKWNKLKKYDCYFVAFIVYALYAAFYFGFIGITGATKVDLGSAILLVLVLVSGLVLMDIIICIYLFKRTKKFWSVNIYLAILNFAVWCLISRAYLWVLVPIMVNTVILIVGEICLQYLKYISKNDTPEELTGNKDRETN